MYAAQVEARPEAPGNTHRETPPVRVPVQVRVPETAIRAKGVRPVLLPIVRQEAVAEILTALLHPEVRPPQAVLIAAEVQDLPAAEAIHRDPVAADVHPVAAVAVVAAVARPAEAAEDDRRSTTNNIP